MCETASLLGVCRPAVCETASLLGVCRPAVCETASLLGVCRPAVWSPRQCLSSCTVTLFTSYRLRGLLSRRPETDGKGSCRSARLWCSNRSVLPTVLCCQLQMTTHCHNYVFNPLSNNITRLPFASSLNY